VNELYFEWFPLDGGGARKRALRSLHKSAAGLALGSRSAMILAMHTGRQRWLRAVILILSAIFLVWEAITRSFVAYLPDVAAVDRSLAHDRFGGTLEPRPDQAHSRSIFQVVRFPMSSGHGGRSRDGPRRRSMGEGLVRRRL